MNNDSLKIFPPTKQPPQLNVQQAFSNFKTQCSGFLQHLSHFQTSLSSLQDRAKQALEPGFLRSGSFPFPSDKNPVWARIGSNSGTQMNLTRQLGSAMSTEAIEERLAGVPVYALSNSNEQFVLVSGVASGKSLGLLCFKKEDAETLLEQMRGMDPAMGKEGSRVVPVALNKVFQLKVKGVAFRLIPESDQIKNALKEREKVGSSDDAFCGVPVFQSRSLVLRSKGKSYRPVFFRKEDLEKSLKRASSQQNKLNPAFKSGDIQVAVFEDIIKGMKEGSTSAWNDVVFVPPGFDVSTENTQQ
ncbi:Protein TIC 22-like, chloroplastic [Melia azedarach]|uniref:Protein TIC 22-like, chloroplastic n=1 Tax=Melia azedarach TaxID=155640 RepID=A0ACC1YGZ7_MELAZ|nr:Protein TIC 22-like, chloroplastic [Melia azedarach]